MARTTLTASGLPPNHWVESVKNAVYIRNRLPDAGGLAHFKSYLAVFLPPQNFIRLDVFHLCYWTKANARSLILNLKTVSYLQTLITETIDF
jgi:hypothetical protein